MRTGENLLEPTKNTEGETGEDRAGFSLLGFALVGLLPEAGLSATLRVSLDCYSIVSAVSVI